MGTPLFSSTADTRFLSPSALARNAAIGLWISLVLRSYFREWQLLGWIWFATIFIGSVDLGWHYALDSVVAMTIALLAFLMAGKLINRPKHVPELVAQPC